MLFEKNNIILREIQKLFDYYGASLTKCFIYAFYYFIFSRASRAFSVIDKPSITPFNVCMTSHLRLETRYVFRRGNEKKLCAGKKIGEHTASVFPAKIEVEKNVLNDDFLGIKGERERFIAYNPSRHSTCGVHRVFFRHACVYFIAVLRNPRDREKDKPFHYLVAFVFLTR